MRLAGRHAVVTGGGSGIGAATARALAAEGAAVTLIGRRMDPLEAVAAALSRACAIAADVTDPAAIKRAFAAAREASGPIDILVNNAGDAVTQPFAKANFDAWRAMFAVNVDGAWHCTRAALPDLKAAPSGRVINLASTAGLKGYAYATAYTAAKHALIGLTRALAIELAGTQVTVNAVCPGFTNTPLADAAIADIEARSGGDGRAALAAFNPQQRLIEPEEVAATIVWLALPENRSITGQAIVVAGGEL